MADARTARSRLAALAAWLPFALIAVLFHAAWWMSAPPGNAAVQAENGRGRTSFAFMTVPPHGDRAWHGDIRALWSPALFSLPTPMGFSAPLLADAASLGPPENPAVALPFLAPREKYLPAEPALDASSFLRSSVSSLPVRVVSSPAFPTVRAETNNVIHIMWTDARGVLKHQSVDVGNAAQWTDRKPWDAQALLELDEQGSVRHAFLEKATDFRDRNSALIRILYALRLDSTSTARTARITVRYDGAAVTEEAAAKP